MRILIRIYAKVENVGRSVARYTKPLLTIEDENLDQLVYAECSELRKSSKGCLICDVRIKSFLCPYPYKVERNYFARQCSRLRLGVDLMTDPTVTSQI